MCGGLGLGLFKKCFCLFFCFLHVIFVSVLMVKIVCVGRGVRSFSIS